MTGLTQVSDERGGDERRADHVPELVALGSFLGVLLAGAGLILIELQVPAAVRSAAPWVLGVAVILCIRLGVPRERLTPDRREQRDERRAGGLVGVLSACTVLAAVTAATYLTSWSQWVVLGALAMLTVGGIVMLHVRFTIGP